MTEKKMPLWAVNRGISVIKHRENIGELLLLSAFFLYSIKYIFDFSGIFIRNEMLNSVLVLASYGLVMAKIIFFQNYTLKRIILTAAVVSVLVISSSRGTNNHFQMGLFFLLAMQNTDLRKIIKLGLRIKATVIIIHVVWYIFIYITDPSVITFSYRAGAGLPRHYFFMGHANTFSAILLWASFEYIFLKYDKLRLIDMLAVWAISILFFIFTSSYAVMVILFVTTVLIMFDKIGRQFIDKLLTFVARFSYIFFAGLFAFLSAVYTRLDGSAKELVESLDSLMTGRLWPGAYAHEVYGFTLMGRWIRPITAFYWHDSWRQLYVPFDNNYLANLYHYGIIHLIVTAIALIALSRKMETREKIIIIAFSFFAIMQGEVTNPAVCFVLFLIGKYIYKEKSDVIKEDKPGVISTAETK